MGGVAASGGYYMASPATRIFANPATITGSIGIFYGKADVAELLHRDRSWHGDVQDRAQARMPNRCLGRSRPKSARSSSTKFGNSTRCS